MSPHPYSRVTSMPNGTRFELITPQPLQFVPQPSMTVAQDPLNESTARDSAYASVSHGDQAHNTINNTASDIPANNFPGMASIPSLKDVSGGGMFLNFIVYTLEKRKARYE